LIIETAKEEVDSPTVQQVLSRVDSDDPRQFLRNLFNFVADNVEYEKDPSDVENVSTPRRLLQDEIGDCKKMTVFIASVVLAKGWKPLFRVISYNGKTYAHIYPIIANEKGQYITMDVVNNEQFDKEVDHVKRLTYNTEGKLVDMELNLLSGLDDGAVNPPYGNYYGRTMVNAGNYPGNQLMNFGTCLAQLDEDLNGIIGRGNHSLGAVFNLGLEGWENWVQKGDRDMYALIPYMRYFIGNDYYRHASPVFKRKALEFEKWLIDNTKKSYGSNEARLQKALYGLYNGFLAKNNATPKQVLHAMYVEWLKKNKLTTKQPYSYYLGLSGKEGVIKAAVLLVAKFGKKIYNFFKGIFSGREQSIPVGAIPTEKDYVDSFKYAIKNHWDFWKMPHQSMTGETQLPGAPVYTPPGRPPADVIVTPRGEVVTPPAKQAGLGTLALLAMALVVVGAVTGGKKKKGRR